LEAMVALMEAAVEEGRKEKFVRYRKRFLLLAWLMKGLKGRSEKARTWVAVEAWIVWMVLSKPLVEAGAEQAVPVLILMMEEEEAAVEEERVLL